jgi:26S proteasome regulatory subunit N5
MWIFFIRKLLDLFTVDEIISWKEVMQKGYESILRKGTKTSPATDVFDGNTETGEKRWRDLHVRVGEHVIIYI